MAKKRRFIAVSVIALSILVASPALASTSNGNNKASYSAKYFFGKNKNGAAYAKPSVIGKVSGIAGESLTVTDKNGVAYAVNAASSEVKEGFNKAGTLADIKLGDTVLIQGTLSGSTTVEATSIRDTGTVAAHEATSSVARSVKNKTQKTSSASSSSSVAAQSFSRATGTIQSISGTTFSLLTGSSTTLTIDASSARIVLGGTARLKNIATGTISSLHVNDKVMVSGEKDASNSSLIKAKMVRDVSHS